MPKWYRRDASAMLEDMRGLSLDERGAYITIVDLIHDRAGKVPDDDRYIAGMMGVRLDVWRRKKRRLIELQKLQVIDGCLSCVCAESELRRYRVYVESCSRGGRESASARNKNNNIAPSAVDGDGQHVKRIRIHESNNPARERAREIPDLRIVQPSYSEWDFVSTDGSVHFKASELEAMKLDYPSLKDVRASVRQAVRWADAENIEPEHRKSAVLSWLAKKNLQAEPVRSREIREAERESGRTQRQTASAKKLSPII